MEICGGLQETISIKDGEIQTPNFKIEELENQLDELAQTNHQQKTKITSLIDNLRKFKFNSSADTTNPQIQLKNLSTGSKTS